MTDGTAKLPRVELPDIDAPTGPELARAAAAVASASARLERERLVFERERTQAGSSEPWWRTTVGASVVTAVLGATVTFSSAGMGYFQRLKELDVDKKKYEQEAALKEKELSHTAAMDFLDRMMKSPSENVATLKLIEVTSQDDKLKAWAAQQIVPFEQQIEDVKKEAKENEEAANEARSTRDTLQRQLATAVAEKVADAHDRELRIAALQRQIQEQTNVIANLQSHSTKAVAIQVESLPVSVGVPPSGQQNGGATTPAPGKSTYSWGNESPIVIYPSQRR